MKRILDQSDLSLNNTEEVLFLSFYKAIKAIAANRAIANSDCEYDDLVQEISIKIIKLIKNGKLEDKPAGYIFICIKNACFDYMRSNKMKFNSSEDYIIANISSDDHLENSTHIKDLINRVLSTMADTDKIIFKHCFGLGTNPKNMTAIGKIMHRTPPHLRMRKSITMRALRNNNQLRGVVLNENNI